MIKLKEDNIKGGFIDDSSAYLLNNEFDAFEAEIAYICTQLKKSVDSERYKKVPDLLKPQ